MGKTELDEKAHAVVLIGRSITGRPETTHLLPAKVKKNGEIQVTAEYYYGEGNWCIISRVAFPARWLEQPEGWEDELREMHRIAEAKKDEQKRLKAAQQQEAVEAKERETLATLLAKYGLPNL